MKPPEPKRLNGALTIIELLVILAILAILAMILIPMLPQGDHEPAVGCMSNQKQVAVADIMWLADHDEKSAWQIPIADGATLELIDDGIAASHFKPLSLYFGNHPELLVCPTDKAREPAERFQTFGNSNLSYFINLDAATSTNLNTATNIWNSILSGDRHLKMEGQPVKQGLFVLTTNATAGWTDELHETIGGGVVAFADGHVEWARPDRLLELLPLQSQFTNRLVVP